MKWIKENWGAMIGVIFFILVSALFLETATVMPKNAVVIIDDDKKIYYAPIPDCLDGVDKSSLRITISEKADELKYSPEEKCRDGEGFVQNSRVLFVLLDKYNIWSTQNRWNEDGSWNW